MNFCEIEFPFDEAENYLRPGNKEKMKKFFYKGNIYEKIRKDSTYFLVGDKGSGKTAYSAYYCNNTIEGNIKSKIYQISVDDYNKIIQMKKDGKLDYTHYTTLWKAIILIKLCSSLDSSEVSVFGKNGYKKIQNLLKKYKFTKFTEDAFSPVSFMDTSEFSINHELNVEKFNVNPQVGQTITKSSQNTKNSNVYIDNWVTFINEISEEISHLRLTNTHYLFVDGIDSRPSDIDFKSYSECVYPLIRAVYDLNFQILSKIKERKKGRLQVILLTRLDIFLQAGLGNPGSKLSDNCAYIDWNTTEDDYESSEIYNVVSNIIGQSNGVNWKTFFDFQICRGDSKFSSFVYFLRLTTGKPRDFVRALTVIKELCEKKGIKNPNASIIEDDSFQRAYSSYYIDKIRTALSFTFNQNEIDLLFEFLTSIGKRYLQKKEFIQLYNDYSKKNELDSIFGDVLNILKILFDNDMIGVHEGNGIYRWKGKETSISNYNYEFPFSTVPPKTKIIFNWGLEKGFSMYIKM